MNVVGTTVVRGTLLLPERVVVVMVVEPVVREREMDSVKVAVLPDEDDDRGLVSDVDWAKAEATRRRRRRTQTRQYRRTGDHGRAGMGSL